MKTEYIDLEDGGIICTKTDSCNVVKADGSTDISLLVSTQIQDSDGDVVHQRKNKNGAGWDLERFNKGPVITWSHDLWTPNMSGPKTRGKVKKTENKGPGLHLDPLQFDEGDTFAMGLDGKFRRGVPLESSVGFRALKRDRRKNEEGMTTGFDIWESQLIEVAIVNRGANPETETLAKRLLTRAEVAKDLETGGSAEIEEFKEEIEHLARMVKDLGDELKLLGDRTENHEHERQMVKEAKATQENLVKAAAEEILAALTAGGIARNGN